MYPQEDWHFWSTDKNEKIHIGIEDSWVEEGSFWVPKEHVKGVIPVYRCFNKDWKSHFWSTDRTELAGRSGFVDQGVAFYIFQHEAPGTVPFVRFALTSGTASNIHHFYTKAPLGPIDGWTLEGTIGYVYDHLPVPTDDAQEVFRSRIVKSNWICQLADASGQLTSYGRHCQEMFKSQADSCCVEYMIFTNSALKSNLRATPVRKE